MAILQGVPTAALRPYLWPALLAAVVSIPPGLAIFHQAERYARRTGKLKQDG